MSLIRVAAACVLLPCMASVAACRSSATGGSPEPGTDGGADLADSSPTGSNDSGILAADSGGAEVDSGSDAGSPPSGEGGVKDAAPDGGGSAFGTGTTYSPVYMCASGGTCTGNIVTGGGAMPSTSGSPSASGLASGSYEESYAPSGGIVVAASAALPSGWNETSSTSPPSELDVLWRCPPQAARVKASSAIEGERRILSQWPRGPSPVKAEISVDGAGPPAGA